MLSELTWQVEKRTSFSSLSAVTHTGALKRTFLALKPLNIPRQDKQKVKGKKHFSNYRMQTQNTGLQSHQHPQQLEKLSGLPSSRAVPLNHKIKSGKQLNPCKQRNYYHNQNSSNIWTRRQVVSCFCTTIKSNRNDCTHACVLQSHVECGFLSNNCSLSRGKEEFTGKRTLML